MSVIATFAPTTGWSGRTITFDNEVFTLQDHGPISASDVLTYDSQGHLVWAHDEMRAWVESRAAAPQAANDASTSADIASTLASGWAKLAASAGVVSVAVGKAAESTKVSFSEGRAAARSNADCAPSSPEASTSAVEPMLAAEPTPVVEEAVPPAPNSETAAIPVDTLVTSIAVEIAKLAELHAKGVLTDEEFAAYKVKLVR